MESLSLFDIAGPIMIGPSSSHTAGAVRLGKIAANLVEGTIKEVKIYLHGSFAATYRGHGTDKALLAGILGFNPSDEQIKDSPAIAQKRGLQYSIITADLGDVHPNSVKFDITLTNGQHHSVTGSSLGGGRIMITGIDDMEMNFSGDKPIIIAHYHDTPGIIATISTLLYEREINIGNMQVRRCREDQTAYLYMETDSLCDRLLEQQISSINGMYYARIINPSDHD